MPYYNRDPKRDHNFDNHPFVYWGRIFQSVLIWEFSKLGLPYFGVLIIRILLTRVLYSGPLFSETPISFYARSSRGFQFQKVFRIQAFWVHFAAFAKARDPETQAFVILYPTTRIPSFSSLNRHSPVHLPCAMQDSLPRTRVGCILRRSCLHIAASVKARLRLCHKEPQPLKDNPLILTDKTRR